MSRDITGGAALEVTGLSKRYQIGRFKGSHDSLVVSVGSRVRKMLRATGAMLRPAPPHESTGEELWALRDVSFSARIGEVVGIVGRNGAGKSTLLKILSRITPPSSGQAVIRGRVASLLEVGTGFHPELTGRENVFLNGMILGMRRPEIARRFDEIVEFSGIERFIDTPVKRYSSGMYVRLAFAVAAHLEAEVLIVDEVLAVGDFDFQRKCLARMQSVSTTGRTVLFVSHNLGAIQQLCTRAILLQGGKLTLDAEPAAVVDRYLQDGLAGEATREWTGDSAPRIPGLSVLRRIRALDSSGAVRSMFDVTEPIVIELEYERVATTTDVSNYLEFRNEYGQLLFISIDEQLEFADVVEGTYRARCFIPRNLLNTGIVRIEWCMCTRPTSEHYVSVADAIALHVTDAGLPGGARGQWTREWPPTMVRPALLWQQELVRGQGASRAGIRKVSPKASVFP